MASIMKPVRLVNPSKRKRRMTLAQKLFFGSKRQRAAAKEAMKGSRHKRRSSNPKRRKPSSHKATQDTRTHGFYGTNKRYKKAVKKRDYAKAMYYNRQQEARRKKHFSERLLNVGEIITIRPLANTGHKTKKGRKHNPMAKRRRKSGISHQAAVKRARKAARTRTRHHSYAHRNPAKRSYPRRKYKGQLVRYRYIGRNPHHRTRRRRGNPGGSVTSTFGKAVGIIGGALVTSLATNLLPASLNTGIPGYLATAVVAVLQGQAVGKLLKKPALGNDMTVGGFVYLALKIAKDFFPSLSLPFSLNGLGVIGPSSFWTPQVPMMGSMGTFIPPAQLTAAIPPPAPVTAGMKGMGSVRRMGRFR